MNDQEAEAIEDQAAGKNPVRPEIFDDIVLEGQEHFGLLSENHSVGDGDTIAACREKSGDHRDGVRQQAEARYLSGGCRGGGCLVRLGSLGEIHPATL